MTSHVIRSLVFVAEASMRDIMYRTLNLCEELNVNALEMACYVTCSV